jgi:hypothetical protein
MSANADSMAASYAVMISRARERNCDLRSSIFRWSAGSFYEYLAQNSWNWGYYDRCLRYLKKAVYADPALLLKTGIYRRFMGTLRRIIANPREKHRSGEALSLSLEKKGKGPTLNSNKKGKRPFISNRIFENIERRRLSSLIEVP